MLPLIGMALLAESVRKSKENGDQRAEDRRLILERQDEDRAYMNEQRGRQRRAWEQQDTIESAGKPVTVDPMAQKPDTMDNIDVGAPGEAPVPVTGFKVGGQSFATQAQADAAARPQNTQFASMTRMRDAAMKAGRADLAVNYGDIAKKLEAEGWTDFHRANSFTGVTPDDIKAGRVPDRDVAGAPEFNGIGKIKIPDGAKVRATVDDLGRPDYILVDKDGNQIENMSGNTIDAIFNYANHRAERKDRVAQMDKEADNKRLADVAASQEKRWQEQLDEQRRHNRAVEGLSSVRMSRAGAGQAPGTAPVWDKDADKLLLSQYTIVDPDAGTKRLDGEGFQFGKQVALARSQANGGDYSTAIAAATATDRELVKLAGGDAGKLRALRQNYLRRITGQDQPPAPAQPSNQSQPAAPAPRPAVTMAQPRQPAPSTLRDNPRMAREIEAATSALRTLQAQAAAAAKSGDANAIIQWGNKVNEARAGVRALVSKLPAQEQEAILGGL